MFKLGMVLALALLAGRAAAEERTAFAPAQIARAAKDAATARADFDKLLFDYTSARFRDVRARSRQEADWTVFCGFVNSKNRYGAYTGWQPFVWSSIGDDRIFYVGDDSHSMIFNNAMCADGPANVWDLKDYAESLTYRPH